jgi:glutamate racemase
MDDPAAPLLFFDTGVGGLSVLAAAQTALPMAPIVYAADYAGLPYGTKSEAEIAARVPALLGRLVERYRPRLVIIACNTACTIALTHVRASLLLEQFLQSSQHQNAQKPASSDCLALLPQYVSLMLTGSKRNLLKG